MVPVKCTASLLISGFASFGQAQNFYEPLDLSYPGTPGLEIAVVAKDAEVILGKLTGTVNRAAVWKRGSGIIVCPPRSEGTLDDVGGISNNGVYASLGRWRWQIGGGVQRMPNPSGLYLYRGDSITNDGRFFFGPLTSTSYKVGRAEFSTGVATEYANPYPYSGVWGTIPFISSFGEVLYSNAISSNRYGDIGIRGVVWSNGGTGTPLPIYWQTSGNPVLGGLSGASSDGQWWVGKDGGIGGPRAVRGTASGTMEVLFGGSAPDITNDGRVVVGLDSNGTTPILWIQGHGSIPLLEFMRLAGSNGAPATSVFPPRIKGDGSRILWGNGYFHWDRTIHSLPTAFSINKGVFAIGDLAALASRDGIKVLFLSSWTLQSEFEASGTLPTASISELRLNVSSSVARYGMVQTLYWRNFSNSSWVPVDGRLGSTTDSSFTVSRANPANYIGLENRVQAKLHWQPLNDEDPQQDGWLHSIDLFQWRFKPN